MCRDDPVGSLKLYFAFTKQPCKRYDILQNRPMIGAHGGEAPKLPRAIRVGPNEGGGEIWGPNSGRNFWLMIYNGLYLQSRTLTQPLVLDSEIATSQSTFYLSVV